MELDYITLEKTGDRSRLGSFKEQKESTIRRTREQSHPSGQGKR